MKVRQIFYTLPVLLFCGCLESDFESNDLIIDNEINYLHTSLDMNNFPNDPYKVLGIMPEEDLFNVIVEYSGGCEEHRFYTWWDGQWTGDTPSGTFHLLHEDGGDACERIVRDTIQLDLNLVFNNRYPTEPVFVTAKNAHDKKTITVDPFMVQVIQGQTCDLKASLESMLCVQGIWGNKGFLLQDSISGHEQVWIQPVKNSNDITLDMPLSGKYNIHVTPVFGFELHSQDANCHGQPEGSFLPAAVNCMEKL